MNIGDLRLLRTAPILNEKENEIMLDELVILMNNADWFTVGIMSPSLQLGLSIIRRMEERFKWPKMKMVTTSSQEGPIFIKANQNSGEIHARVEYGLGKGILIGCQNYDSSIESETLGPFPLDFFDSMQPRESL